MTDSQARVFVPQSTNEMQVLVRTKDWSATHLGPIEGWSPSLRLAVDIILSSGFPMALRWGPDFVLIYNDGYKTILGEKHPWALGLPAREAWSEVWHRIEPIHRDILNGIHGAVFSEDVLLRIKRRHDQWEDARFTLSYSPTPDATAPNGIGGIFVTAVETTARVEAEHQLRAAEDALRRINESLEQTVEARTRERDRLWRNSRDLLCVVEQGGIFRAANPAWLEILGWSPGEVVGRHHFDFIHPDDRPSSQEALTKASLEVLPAYENRVRHRDGSYRWVSWVAAPEEDLVYASGRHVTAEKEAAAELAAAQDALRQSQKLEAIGQLTGGVAHDFNNLLTIIRSSADLLRRRNLTEDRQHRYLDAIAETADRGAKLTSQLLAFARRQALSPSVFDVAERLESVREMLGTVLGSRVLLELDMTDRPAPVEADTIQFETALVNLAANARDAMSGMGTFTIRLGPAAPTNGRNRVGSGERVLITISDTGCGIPADKLPHVFEPFFTTKEVGRGTGLGLSQVYGFTHQSGGQVTVKSRVGEGTTFTIELPRSGKKVEAPQESRFTPAVLPNEHCCVLVVEDNAEVGEFSTQLLNDLGHQTMFAANALDALKLLEERPRAFDLVFSDVVMPGMNGLALGQEVRKRWPHLPFVLTSGYSEGLSVEGALGFPLLHKPYSLEALSSAIRQALSVPRQENKKDSTIPRL